MKRQDFLNAASDCVCKSREEQYGSPEDSFGIIAQLWELYIQARCVCDQDTDVIICPEDVANLMALLKIARIAGGNFKADSYVDAIGYLACAGEIAGRENND